MFGVLRIFIGIIIGVILIILLHKHLKKERIILSSAIIIVFIIFVTTILGFVPFENLLYNFRSAEEVYNYYYYGETQIDMVIEGEESDFVVGTKNNASTFLIVPKTDTGWSIGIGLNTKKVTQIISKDYSVYVYQYKNTNDFFITILDTNGGELTISDEYNTKFLSLERNNDSLGKTFITYYAHISNLNPQYSIVVNDNKIVLGNQ